MEHYEEVLKLLHDQFDWKLTDSLTTTGKKLVADTIKALKIAENNQALQLPIHDVVVELPSKNSREFKDWLKSEGYKNKGFGIYQKENKDYCYTLLYKHFCNVIEFGN